MKPFNINEHLEHPDWKVVTRDGAPVRILCTDRKGGGDHPIVALYPASQKYLGEIVCTFCANGEFTKGMESDHDLFFAPEKHEGWVNLYRDLGLGVIRCRCVFDSEEDAEKEGMTDKTYIATTKIQWEE